MESVNVTAKDAELSRLVILAYLTLLEGKVPAPGFKPLKSTKLIDVVSGQVTILLSTLVTLATRYIVSQFEFLHTILGKN